jgi:hypothetical protein
MNSFYFPFLLISNCLRASQLSVFNIPCCIMHNVTLCSFTAVYPANCVASQAIRLSSRGGGGRFDRQDMVNRIGKNFGFSAITLSCVTHWLLLHARNSSGRKLISNVFVLSAVATLILVRKICYLVVRPKQANSSRRRLLLLFLLFGGGGGGLCVYK